SSAPHENDITITTRITPENGSSFKKHLADMKPGDTIEADAPEGDFVIDGYDRDYIFVVGGIGITPFRSILSQMEHDDKGANIEILYANRSQDTKAYKDELEALSSKHTDINVRDFYGDNIIDQAALEAAGAKLNDPTYYISGPEPMVEAFEKVLDNMGVDDAHKRFDYFPGYDEKSQ
ncbi:MAG: ferredoxin--NADP reductase, partial [Candidatus Saccharimonadales bacterium]